MPGTYKQGFTLIELLVVILLLGIMAAIVVPNLQQRLPGYERKAFVTELNTLVALGWQAALTSQKVHRIFFDFKKRIMNVDVEEQGPGTDNMVYKPITQAYRKTFYEWPENIEIKDFYIGGINEFKSDLDVTTLWFFIVPDGLCQDVIMNIVDTSQTTPIQLGLVLNPFTAQFKEYDTFQKP